MSSQGRDSVQREKWDRLAPTWYEAGPPSTPSRGDLVIYRGVLERERPSVVVLLGCTPSLRRLVATTVVPTPEIVIADFSRRMFDVTTAITRPTWRETFVCGDWCDPWDWDGRADVVLGDRALDNVEPSRRRECLERIREHSGSDSLFVCHTAVTDNAPVDVEVEDLVEYWAGEWQGGVSLQDCVDGLWDDLLSIAATPDRDGLVLSMDRLWPELSRLAQARRGAAREVTTQLQRRYGSSRSAEWYTGSIGSVAASARGLYGLEDVVYSDDYRAAVHHPFLMLRAK